MDGSQPGLPVGLIESISSPADVRRLSYQQLDLLAEEIRAFVVHAVSVTGGHLGSNLGVVELTLAVHRVFDSPDDIVLWDTGHQAYVHKIVTGRAGDFGRPRPARPPSGLPGRAGAAPGARPHSAARPPRRSDQGEHPRQPDR